MSDNPRCATCAYFRRYQMDPRTGYCGCGHSAQHGYNQGPDNSCRHYEKAATP